MRLCRRHPSHSKRWISSSTSTASSTSPRSNASSARPHTWRFAKSARAGTRAAQGVARRAARQRATQESARAAIRYARSNWTELGRFLDDARIPLDNNPSERALRRVALGRKNFLFVGDIEAGKNIAGSTRSSPPVRRAASIPSSTSRMCSHASGITRRRASMSCCPARGPRLADSRQRRPTVTLNALGERSLLSS